MKVSNRTKGSVICQQIQQQMEQGNFTRKAFEEGIVLKKQYGEDKVFDLSLGNPILDPPKEFYEELRRLANNPLPGMHRYMVNAGYPETRAEIARYLAEETGLPFTANEIVMSIGAAGGLCVTLRTLLNQGDEVILFAPHFPEYLLYIGNQLGVAKVLPTDSNFNPDLKALEKTITRRTKAVIINSPNNPTGVVYSEDTLQEIGQILQSKESHLGTQIFIVSDEPYRKLIYDGKKCPYLFGFHPRTIMLTSHSKDLSLAGERIGYVAINPECNKNGELGAAITFCNRALGYVNAPALMQRVVGKLQRTSVNVPEYQRKRDFLYTQLIGMGYSVIKPGGAFYLFPKAPGGDDLKFTDELKKSLVLTVPGIAYGTPGYFRIGFCAEDWVLKGCLAGFREAARKYGLGGDNVSSSRTSPGL
jgi:aspartate aminotransferase